MNLENETKIMFLHSGTVQCFCPGISHEATKYGFPNKQKQRW